MTDLDIAKDPSTPDDTLIALLHHKKWHVRFAAATNPGASEAVRLAALAIGAHDLAFAIGTLGDTLSPTVTDAIFAHQSREGRIELGKQTRDPYVVRKVATDADPNVRAIAAASPACPRDLVLYLAADPRAWVRRQIARREDCPPDLLPGFARDRSSDVRWAVLSAHTRDRDLALLLLNDPVSFVRAQAQENLRGWEADDED